MINKDKLFFHVLITLCGVLIMLYRLHNTSLRQHRLESVEKQKLSIVGLINLAINFFFLLCKRKHFTTWHMLQLYQKKKNSDI